MRPENQHVLQKYVLMRKYRFECHCNKKTDYEGIGGPIHFLRKNKKTINDGVTTMNPRLWDRRNV
ncbi:hypothetical protein T11_10476 [Trichinella zimbabwensis]|uniref:Uncharacterized protein n=1 Tax=Trichinella zimbabwensis TaxID=268475 RepID=A0A0V1HSX1_9BILA|nr:hypothetical protein T11_10476 [Trichinella zimbabwensis]